MSDQALLATAVVGISGAILLAVVSVAGLTGGRDVSGRAITALHQYRGGKAPIMAEKSARERLLQPIVNALRRLAVRLSPSGKARALQLRLDVAGNPQGWTVERVLGTKGVGLFVLGVFGMLFGSKGGLATSLLVGGAAAAAGFYVPDLLLYNAGLKRQELIRGNVADVVDMLTVCVEAGLGFNAALGQVARNGKGPLAAEMVRVLQEMQIGKSRAEALRSLSARTTVAELKAVIAGLVQADALGIPVAAVLREQSKEMRLKRRQRAEAKAQQVTVKILFPLIFCIFPTIFIVVLGPAVISMIKTFSGH